MRHESFDGRSWVNRAVLKLDLPLSLPPFLPFILPPFESAHHPTPLPFPPSLPPSLPPYPDLSGHGGGKRDDAYHGQDGDGRHHHLERTERGGGRERISQSGRKICAAALSGTIYFLTLKPHPTALSCPPLPQTLSHPPPPHPPSLHSNLPRSNAGLPQRRRPPAPASYCPYRSVHGGRPPSPRASPASGVRRTEEGGGRGG